MDLLVEQEYISLIIDNALSAELSKLSLDQKSEEKARSVLLETNDPDLAVEDKNKPTMVNGETKVTIQLMSSTTAHNMNTSRVKDMEAMKGITSIAQTKNEANSVIKSIETTRTMQINKDTKTTKNLKNTTVSSSEVDKIQDNKVISEKKKLPVFSMLCSKANVDIPQHNTNS
ncbi:Hypothetical predicted protein, partial [Pelobates cultripes]